MPTAAISGRSAHVHGQKRPATPRCEQRDARRAIWPSGWRARGQQVAPCSDAATRAEAIGVSCGEPMRLVPDHRAGERADYLAEVTRFAALFEGKGIAP
ncbi:hypothetical protein [Nocardia transvalensis]|uniref:hypothetical protein n=1 Tax=Nocardia transvalensis TaxID=37333 RepID=UPI001894C415|nr:hypothetical protein [Nocardia transvalensis]MBF6333564.1 hypothetical protein [Nocardia transvalensis]